MGYLDEFIDRCTAAMTACESEIRAQVQIINDLRQRNEGVVAHSSTQAGPVVGHKYQAAIDRLLPPLPVPQITSTGAIRAEPKPVAEPSRVELAEDAPVDLIPGKAIDRLNTAEYMLGGLSKRFLKDVQKQLGVYAGGTNRNMVESLVAHLEEVMDAGGSLREELSVIKEVHKECYPSCTEIAPESSESD